VEKEYNVFFELYSQKENYEIIIHKRTFTEFFFYTIKMVLSFYVSFLIPVLGIINFVLWKYNRPNEAIWPKLGTILGFLASATLYFYSWYLSWY
jgi:hypothetical protein